MNDLTQVSDDLYPIGLFEGTGIELEYMIIDSDSINIAPICDQVLKDVSGSFDNEVYPEGEDGFSAWSNELALHVLEFKSINPIKNLSDSGTLFHKQVSAANRLLKKYNAKLLPTAMHPWMDPEKEFRIWPHGSKTIYETFNNIFRCKGHGWSNLQSMHINLPFKNNEEFIKLHTAIRILLPVMSSLTASSPFIEGKFSGFHDTRVEVYRTNSALIPSITGYIIPEPVTGINEYKTQILDKIYLDLEKYDPDRIISHEWVNARGCIARFSRGAIEIRTCDIQETPFADIASASLIIKVLKNLVSEEISPFANQLKPDTEKLCKILISNVKNGDSDLINDPEYQGIFGFTRPCSVRSFWEKLAAKYFYSSDNETVFLENIFKHGNLSSRILKAAGESPSHETLKSVYRDISYSLASGEQFLP